MIEDYTPGDGRSATIATMYALADALEAGLPFAEAWLSVLDAVRETARSVDLAHGLVGAIDCQREAFRTAYEVGDAEELRSAAGAV